MDSLGIVTQLIIPTQILPAPVPQAAPAPDNSAAVAKALTDQAQLHQAAPTESSRTPIANPHILGDATYAMFTVGGKLYTRVSNKVDGRVEESYVPQDPPLDIKA